MTDHYALLRERYTYCVVCGSTQGPMEAHHVVYRSRGGGEEGNLVLLCQECHTRVHAEVLRLSIVDGKLSIDDPLLPEVVLKPLVDQTATAPSEVVDEFFAVQRWMDHLLHSDRLRAESDEALRLLYQEVRQLKRRAWMIQAAIIAVMQERAVRGDQYREAIAEAVGCHVRTVNARGQIYRDILSNPECSQALEIVEEESFYREAVTSDDPAKWINYAAEKKVENPKYTVSQFRAEMRSNGDESSLQRVVMYCREPNTVDQKLAEALERKLGVPVLLVVGESALETLDRPVVRISGGSVSDLPGFSDCREGISTEAQHNY